MKIAISESNDIVRFIRRMRNLVNDSNKPFPEDICTLTREFLAWVGLYVLFGVIVAFFIFIMYWTVLVYTFGPTEGGDIFIAAIGTLLWGLVGFVAIAYSRMRLIEGGYIDPMPKRTGPSLRERVATSNEWGLLVSMFQSIKDKTCIRVELRGKEN